MITRDPAYVERLKRHYAMFKAAQQPPQRSGKARPRTASQATQAGGAPEAEAAKAIAVWGGKENTPALIQALRTPDRGLQSLVLEAFAQIKDPAAAEAVAALLVEERGKASDALKAMGSSAEPAVIPFLSHQDVYVRMEAAKVLQTIGTEQCVPALRLLIRPTRNFGLDAMAAGEALKWITFHSQSRRPHGGK